MHLFPIKNQSFRCSLDLFSFLKDHTCLMICFSLALHHQMLSLCWIILRLYRDTLTTPNLTNPPQTSLLSRYYYISLLHFIPVPYEQVSATSPLPSTSFNSIPHHFSKLTLVKVILGSVPIVLDLPAQWNHSRNTLPFWIWWHLSPLLPLLFPHLPID